MGLKAITLKHTLQSCTHKYIFSIEYASFYEIIKKNQLEVF